jgi:hypothetical protein
MLKAENTLKVIIGILLTIVGFFSVQTYLSIKELEKEVVTIRVKLAEFEAQKITRDEIRNLISDYHESHPCTASVKN